MKSIPHSIHAWILTLALCAPVAALAASDSPPTSLINIQADADWVILSDLPKQQRSAATNASQNRQAVVSTWEQKLNQAREFQASYPDDSRSAGARKIELTALLKLQQISGQKPLPLNDALIDDYISDELMPAADRYDISELAKNARSDFSQFRIIDDARSLRARHARELTQEFPGDSRGYGYLLSVAKSLPAGQALEIAAELLNSNAPENIKEGAANLASQKNMEGRILQIKGVNLDACRGRPVVIYSWTAKRPDIFRFVMRHGKLSGVKWIGINIDDDADAARQLAHRLRLPGDQYYDSGGMDGFIASQLHIQTPASVYILDAEGRLVDTRGRENFEDKLKPLRATTQAAVQDINNTIEGGSK